MHSKKQRTVALSTVEAEYIALAFTCQEALWFEGLLNEIFEDCKNENMTICCDNAGAISLSKNQCTSQRTKHIDIRYHFIREIQEQGNIKIKHLPTDEMIADIFTKPLAKAKHVK